MTPVGRQCDRIQKFKGKNKAGLLANGRERWAGGQDDGIQPEKIANCERTPKQEGRVREG